MENPTPGERLRSLDALRGFDMFWITGGAALVRQAAIWKPEPWLSGWAHQLSHVPWDGLRFYDLIFPLFMFLSGVAIPYSIGARLERGGSKAAQVRKILLRAAILVVLGMLYNGVLSGQPGPPRVLSVLGQIGIAWGIAAGAHCLWPSMGRRALLAAGIVLLVTTLQWAVPVPGHGAGVFTPEGSVNAWIDRLIAPGQLYGGSFDPEGLLCILSASAVTLAGGLAGSWLRRPGGLTWAKAGGLFAAGAALTGLGALSWKLGYLPVKALWTGTFDLLAAGISLMIFAAFFAVIDVARCHRWSFPLQVIGVNSLTLYLLTRFFDFTKPAELLFGRLGAATGSASPVVLAAGVILIQWLLLWFLFRRKIFLRV